MKFKLMMAFCYGWLILNVVGFGIWSVVSIEKSYVCAGLLGCCALISFVGLVGLIWEGVKYCRGSKPRHQLTPAQADSLRDALARPAIDVGAKQLPSRMRPEGIKLKRTDRGTDPKYTWRFTPDNCFDCCEPFRERDDSLSFYTVVINSRMTRCCPECFPQYQDGWMG